MEVKMKARFAPIIYLTITVILLLVVSTVWATTYHTVSFTGVPATDFSSDELIQNHSSGYGSRDLYVTWDNTYIYVGFTNTRCDLTDIGIAIDTTNDANGASSSIWGVGFNGNVTKPEYFVGIEGTSWVELRTNNGSDWNAPQDKTSSYSFYCGWNNVPNTEIRIPRSDLGSPSSISLMAWVTHDDQSVIQSSWHTVNPTGTAPQNFYRAWRWSSLGSGISPNSAGTPTAITLRALAAAPALPAALPVAGVIVALGGLGGLVAWRRRRG